MGGAAVAGLLYVVLAGCVCMISGLLFTRPSRTARKGNRCCLPCQCACFMDMVGMALLFALSWYLDVYSRLSCGTVAAGRD